MSLLDIWRTYYLIAWVVTFACCLRIPTKMNHPDNVVGSMLVSMFGFIFWPVVAYCVWVGPTEEKP